MDKPEFAVEGCCVHADRLSPAASRIECTTGCAREYGVRVDRGAGWCIMPTWQAMPRGRGCGFQRKRSGTLMGLFTGASRAGGSAELKRYNTEYRQLLIDGEIIEAGFAVNRDTFLFTNRRLVLVNVQGLSGRKIEYLSIPYGRITRFSIETGASFDPDAELMIWIGGETIPMEKKFNKEVNVYELQKVLASHVLSAS
jgi:hypothetical protein